MMGDFSHYKVISGKLKKRFLLRKPNLNEVSEQFATLGRELRDYKAYSGYCSLAVARCEHSMGNSAHELGALMEAARLFRDSGQINAAISAYRHALKVCEQSLMPLICGQLAIMYKQHKRYIEAAQAFIEGEFNREASECYLLANQHELALECLQKIPSYQLTTEDSVTLFLIKLYLTDPVKSHFQLPIIECNPDYDALVDLNVLLESLLMSMRSNHGDEEAIREDLVMKLFPRLNGLQNQLLCLIVKENNF